MRNVYIIGAGQLGSRHLQALKAVSYILNITVIDPNAENLTIAKERYDTFPQGSQQHQVSYLPTISTAGANDKVDLVIVATSANVRRIVVKEVLQKAIVKFMILEKLLFQKPEDYEEMSRMLEASGTKAWVNCCMRVMPFYKAIKDEIFDKRIFYHVSGSQYGLITNAIHYLDHIAYLTGTADFTIDTSRLIPNPIPSKRKGFLELNGTLTADFANGSQGVITCYPEGNAPTQVQIISPDVRVLVRETEGKAWLASAKDNWQWAEVDARIPYQSEMTTGIVESILSQGECGLTEYKDSRGIHTNLLAPLLSFLKTNGYKDDFYPFT